MDFREQIKSLLKEAELYQQQGLLNEAKERYRKATDLIKQNAHIPNSQQLIAKIVQKVVGLNQAMERINTATSKPQVSDRKQDLIKKLFSSGRETSSDDADLEGAIALAKFGQFERALQEFERLLDREPLRVAAAKNILRCQLELDALDAAVDGYRAWTQDPRFSAAQLQKVKFFLESRLKKSGRTLDALVLEEPRKPAGTAPGGVSADRPAQGIPPAPSPEPPRAVAEDRPSGSAHGGEEEYLDINSVGILFDRGPQKGRMVEFDVSFQTGNAINLIIPGKDRSVIDHLEAGSRLDDIQFFSPIAILNGSGVVTAKTRIKSGPKEGDFSLDIAIIRS